MAIDEDKLNDLLGRFGTDLGAGRAMLAAGAKSLPRSDVSLAPSPE